MVCVYVVWNVTCNIQYIVLSMKHYNIIEYEQYMNSQISQLSDIDNLDAHLEVIYCLTSHDIT